MSSTEPTIVDKSKDNLLRGLPPANTKRWVSRRKAALVLAAFGAALPAHATEYWTNEALLADFFKAAVR